MRLIENAAGRFLCMDLDEAERLIYRLRKAKQQAKVAWPGRGKGFEMNIALSSKQGERPTRLFGWVEEGYR